MKRAEYAMCPMYRCRKTWYFAHWDWDMDALEDAWADHWYAHLRDEDLLGQDARIRSHAEYDAELRRTVAHEEVPDPDVIQSPDRYVFGPDRLRTSVLDRADAVLARVDPILDNAVRQVSAEVLESAGFPVVQVVVNEYAQTVELRSQTYGWLTRTMSRRLPGSPS